MQLTYDKVLVTGGAGFIGSHTVDALLREGIEVWILDDLSTGSLRNLRAWKKHQKLHFSRKSVTTFRAVDSVTRNVDAIVHLAAIVSPYVSLTHPEATNEVNVVGTLNVLKAALKHKVGRVVFASSASLYGNPTETPTAEDAHLDPTTPYGVSKLSAEKYCRSYHKMYDLNTISLRYFNVFGSRQRSNPYSGVIAIFSDLLRKGAPPTIYGDGNQTRDFVHVSDVTNANILALRTLKGAGEAINIGTGDSTSINELARLLADLTGRQDAKPIYKPARQGDIMHSCADATKARSLLGFESRVTLRAGLQDYVLSLGASSRGC